ncbi:MAG: M23 family metallopeptidase [Mucilaginibacter polytrichastri]|nr:M23 family metallopeptidase [Mucilaginibacter polytrichastri]
MRLRFLPAFFTLIFLLHACGTRGPAALFKKGTPHEQYSQALRSSGLAKTALAARWLSSAESSLPKAVSVTLPYRETGFFDAAEPRPASFRFPVKEGQQLDIRLQRRSGDSTKVFIDLWHDRTGEERGYQLVASADTSGKPLTHAVENTGFYILRVQPELLRDVEYTLSVNTGPSFGFPVQKGANSHIGSFWGVDRDGGSRRHEGVDIFAPLRTPAVAAVAGRIVGVNENRLGGLTVWLRPDGQDYTLYYAHLDRQIATEGQIVQPGDTLGLIGNTGNARTTPPHLHFGVYGHGGAVDPLPFINPVIQQAGEVSAPGEWLNADARISRDRLDLQDKAGEQNLRLFRYDQLRILAAERNLFRALLPDGRQVFVPRSSVESLTGFKQAVFTTEKFLLNKPADDGLRRRTIPAATRLDVLAAWQAYYYVKIGGEKGWVKKT